MDKTVSNESKARFVVQYWDQRVFVPPHWDEPLPVSIKRLNRDIELGGYLLLRPLSDITDEEAIRVCELVEGLSHRSTSLDKSKIKWGRIYAEKIFTVNIQYFRHSIHLVDYLRSRGFALPWNGLTVEQMIELGWIKLKDTPSKPVKD